VGGVVELAARVDAGVDAEALELALAEPAVLRADEQARGDLAVLKEGDAGEQGEAAAVQPGEGAAQPWVRRRRRKLRVPSRRNRSACRMGFSQLRKVTPISVSVSGGWRRFFVSIGGKVRYTLGYTSSQQSSRDGGDAWIS
jgi:hypothetical protein